MSVYTFTEKWSNMKYNKQHEEFKNWRPIKPAEMQGEDTAYPVGYCVGSVERGDYKTITTEIQRLTKFQLNYHTNLSTNEE